MPEDRPDEREDATASAAAGRDDESDATAEPAAAADATESADLADATESADLADATESADSADATESADSADATERGDSAELSESGGWLVLAVLVVGVVSMLLVGALLDAPIARQTTEFAIGFVWLLAAAYVGFRLEGQPERRLLGAMAFVAAAVARFVGLLFPSGLLDLASIACLLVGAVVLLSVART